MPNCDSFMDKLLLPRRTGSKHFPAREDMRQPSYPDMCISCHLLYMTIVVLRTKSRFQTCGKTLLRSSTFSCTQALCGDALLLHGVQTTVPRLICTLRHACSVSQARFLVCITIPLSEALVPVDLSSLKCKLSRNKNRDQEI